MTRDSAREAQRLLGLNFSDEKIDQMLPGLQSQLEDYEVMRKFALSNSVPPAIQFNPLPQHPESPSARLRICPVVVNECQPPHRLWCRVGVPSAARAALSRFARAAAARANCSATCAPRPAPKQSLAAIFPAQS